jgi:predicted dehydrogenase
MVKVGIVGVGFMGKMHFNVYKNYPKAKVVALADVDPVKRAGDWSRIGGNVEDKRAANVDLSGIRVYSKAEQLFADKGVDVVDITLPTFLHAKYAVAALKAGKHVVCEKPMALSLADCDRMMAAARAARRVLVVAHCIRFWPEWIVLKKIIDGGKYGKPLAARFYRMSLTPTWSWQNWLLDGRRSGGALVDLHIHDVDYVNYAFGVPKAVRSIGVEGGVSKRGVNSVSTQYLFADGPQVVAEAHWMAAPGFGFTHGFHVVLEKATVEFDSKTNTPLTVHERAGKSFQPPKPENDGYVTELRYFVDCIASGRKPTTVTARDGRNALMVALAEARSVKTGRPVVVGR